MIVLDFASSTILNQILQFFENASVTGMLHLIPHAKQLLYVLAIIDLCTTWSLYDGEQKMQFMAQKILKTGAFFVLIIGWADINHAIMFSFQYAGLTAANISPDGQIIQPSDLLSTGFHICENLFQGLAHVGMNIGSALMYLLTILGVLISFFIMAYQILLTKIEFNIFASIAVVLMPFGAIRFTNFLCQRCISAVFAFGVKLMVMYFMIGLVHNMAGDFANASIETKDFSVMMKYALSYVVLGLLVWKIPNLAAMMVTGQPSMDGMDTLRSMRNYGQRAASAVTPSAIIRKGSSAYGNMASTLATARLRSAGGKLQDGTVLQASGRSVASEFVREKLRQNIASTSWGKGRMQGANTALYNSENARNLKSGRYKTEKQSNRNH